MGNEKFIFGTNNHLFLDNDSNSINNFLKTKTNINNSFIKSKTFISITEFVTKFPQKKLTVFIIPDKNEIYSDNLPFDVNSFLTPQINKDLIAEYNNVKNITICDLFTIFKKNLKSYDDIYSPLDTHININGLLLWINEINKLYDLNITFDDIKSKNQILPCDLLNPINIKEFNEFKKTTINTHKIEKINLVKKMFSIKSVQCDLIKFYSSDKITKLQKFVTNASYEYGIKAPKLFKNVSYFGIDKKSSLYNKEIFHKLPFLKKYESIPSRYLEYFHNTSNTKHNKLLIIGDSFSDFIKNILSCYFKETLFINYAYLVIGLVDDFDPDFVIFEKASRFMLKEK